MILSLLLAVGCETGPSPEQLRIAELEAALDDAHSIIERDTADLMAVRKEAVAMKALLMVIVQVTEENGGIWNSSDLCGGVVLWNGHIFVAPSRYTDPAATAETVTPFTFWLFPLSRGANGWDREPTADEKRKIVLTDEATALPAELWATVQEANCP